MKKYRAKVSATVELDVIIVEDDNGEYEIDDVLEVVYVDEFGNVRILDDSE
jgi:hypothetical protein